MKSPPLNKNNRTTQIIYNDSISWINEIIPGTCFAERVENLCRNWRDTVGKTPAEIFVDDLKGNSELKKYVAELVNEVKENG